MSDYVRQDPPLAASELGMLEAFLDYHRATLLQKVSGVSDDDLRRTPLLIANSKAGSATTMTLLGLVKHMAYVERWWFQTVFAGVANLNFPWTDSDPDADWRIEPDESTAAIMSLYEAEVAKSREVVRQAVIEAGEETRALEAPTKNAKEARSLRWVMLHMLEEVARHNGHADILREAIDGVTGE